MSRLLEGRLPSPRDTFVNGARGCLISVLHMELSLEKKTEYPSSGVFERSPGGYPSEVPPLLEVPSRGGLWDPSEDHTKGSQCDSSNVGCRRPFFLETRYLIITLRRLNIFYADHTALAQAMRLP